MSPDSKDQEEKIKKIVERVMKEKEDKSSEEGKPDDSDEQMKIQKCVVDCSNAHNVARQTMEYCLQQGGKFVEPSHFNKLSDCAELCELVAGFLLRQSDIKKDVLKVSTKACEECAKYCEQFKEDKQMYACAQYSKIAGESCKAIS